MSRYACAIYDVPWIRTTDGDITPFEAIVRGHQIEGLRTEHLTGMQYGAQLRFLTSIAALIAREHLARGNTPDALFDEATVRAALKPVLFATQLRDPDYPFMQLWHADTHFTSEPDTDPLRTLFPWAYTEVIEEFWGPREAAEPSSPEDLTLALATRWFYQQAANGKMKQVKAPKAVPGFESDAWAPATVVTMSNRNTEVTWTGGSLLETVLMNLPVSWVKGGGLPGWADTLGTDSVITDDGLEQMSPLWAATWAKNVCHLTWESNVPAGVSTGATTAFPPVVQPGEEPSGAKDRKEWVASAKKAYKEWRDIIVTAGDPLRVTRIFDLDFGLPQAELLAKWHNDDVLEIMRERSAGRYMIPGRGSYLLFLRTIYGGSNKSVLRVESSRVHSPSAPDLWAPVDRTSRRSLRAISPLLRDVAWKAVGGEFREFRDKKGYLMDYAALEQETVARFWHKADRLISSLMKSAAASGESFTVDKKTWSKVVNAVEVAFQEVLEPILPTSRKPALYMAINRARATAYVLRTPEESTNQEAEEAAA